MQRVRGFTTMRYINLRFTYLLTYLLTGIKMRSLGPSTMTSVDDVVILIPVYYASSGKACLNIHSLKH